MYVKSKMSHITQKNLFSTTSLSVTTLQTGYQMTQKKHSKRKKHMKINSNHQPASILFDLLHLPLISPFFSSPNSYKIVVNRSKKPFFNYVPVCNNRTIWLSNVFTTTLRQWDNRPHSRSRNRDLCHPIHISASMEHC